MDDAVFDHGMNFALARLMIVNSLLGITFGWLYWKQGLESAILAHFMVDAVGFVIVVPAYLSGGILVRTAAVIGLILAGVGSWRLTWDRYSAKSCE